MPAVWRLISHHADPVGAVAWTKRTGRIAIGWGGVGDLTRFTTPDQIGRAVLQVWPESHNWQYAKIQLWDFASTIGKAISSSSARAAADES